jgi:2-dehydropantoate 2-reductase
MKKHAFRRIAIVGSGAIGLYYGIRLAKGGADVRFLLRGDLDAVRRRGSLLLRQEDETVELKPAPVFGSAAEMGTADLVVVAMKTTGNADLPGILAPLVGPQTAVLTLQNGLGSDEDLAGRFGAERVMGGLAFIASTRTGPGEVTCYRSHSITLGEFGRPQAERTRGLAAQFEAAGVEARVVDNLDSARWHKLVWNVPFNGLSIAAGCISTDRICADPALLAEVRALMDEIRGVAAALGHEITDRFLQAQIDVTPPMGAYRPSSLIDFQAGREVEVEAIWGEPLRRGRAAGASLPRLALLHALLRSLAGSRQAAPRP